MSPRVLLVDDQSHTLELVRYNLTKAGLRVLTATTGKEALALMESAPLDLVVLDFTLPDLSGLDLCGRFREKHRAPVIFLTGRCNESDRVRALDAGADDYLTKPFSLNELLARVRALLRRWSWQTEVPTGSVAVGPLTLDLAGRRAQFKGAELHLTPMEFDILRVLAGTPGQVYSRERLLAMVTGQHVEGNARTVDVHIRALRLKLEEDASNPRFLETVRGAGYRLGHDPNVAHQEMAP